MIVPNTNRVLIKPLRQEKNAEIILPGQLKAGETLFLGEVVHPGDTKFKKGQRVYYSEYSAASVRDVGSVLSGDKTLGDSMKEENIYFIVAEDDIMAYDESDKPAN